MKYSLFILLTAFSLLVAHSAAGQVTNGFKRAKPLTSDSVPTKCQGLYNGALSYDNNEQWQMAYDTAMRLIEQCANSNDFTIGRAEEGFSLMQQAAQGLGNYNPLRSNFYNWLKSVLYLNTTDPEYFCQCVYTMAGEVPVPNHIFPDTGFNWNLAVINWLIKNTSCDSIELRGDFGNGRASQIRYWSDASGEYKLDTTLPPLDSIDPGLQELLEKHFLYATVSGTPPPNIINSASITENPFDNSTSIALSVGREAYITIGVYNVLGVQVAGAGYSGVFEQGSRTIPLNMANAPAGAYYVRISTANNETQTLKLTKE